MLLAGDDEEDEDDAEVEEDEEEEDDDDEETLTLVPLDEELALDDEVTVDACCCSPLLLVSSVDHSFLDEPPSFFDLLSFVAFFVEACSFRPLLRFRCDFRIHGVSTRMSSSDLDSFCSFRCFNSLLSNENRKEDGDGGCGDRGVDAAVATNKT